MRARTKTYEKIRHTTVRAALNVAHPQGLGSYAPPARGTKASTRSASAFFSAGRGSASRRRLRPPAVATPTMLSSSGETKNVLNLSWHARHSHGLGACRKRIQPAACILHVPQVTPLSVRMHFSLAYYQCNMIEQYVRMQRRLHVHINAWA